MTRTAETLDENEKNSLIDYISLKRYGKFQKEIRRKLNRYVDLSKNTIIPINEELIEPKQTQQCLSDLCNQADGIIQRSAHFIDEPNTFRFMTPKVEMYQNGDGSVQIGTVTDGGIVNVVETNWKTVILRKHFICL